MGTKIVDGIAQPTTPEDDAQAAADAAAAAVPVVPAIISRVQARVALASQGKLNTIDAYFASANVTPAQREYWASADKFSRTHPMIAQFGPLLGWTPDEVDDLFRAAADIV